jgi:hypothetical protein
MGGRGDADHGEKNEATGSDHGAISGMVPTPWRAEINPPRLPPWALITGDWNVA